MKIAIVLVHNKGDVENIAQIESLKSLIIEVIDGPFIDQETGGSWITIHHELIGLLIPHEIKILQVVPFGVIPPPNRYDINSGGIVYYEKGDEDKVGDHPRFFNWGSKRGIDRGGEIIVHLEDYSKLDVKELPFYLNTLIDPFDKTEYAEIEGIKFVTTKLIKEVGLLDESKDKSKSIKDLKNKVLSGGLKNG